MEALEQYVGESQKTKHEENEGWQTACLRMRRGTQVMYAMFLVSPAFSVTSPAQDFLLLFSTSHAAFPAASMLIFTGDVRR